MSSVRDIDRGYNELVKRIFAMGSPKVSVGIHEADGGKPHEGSELRVIDIGQIHEFGLGVPQRSFIRAWFDENEARAREAIRRLLVSVVEGKRTPDQAVEVFALWVVGQIQQRIASGISPSLDPRTIARKGSSTPLIDTGQLRSSISYEVLAADGSVKKRGVSDATRAQETKAKEEKAAARKQQRGEEKARARERKAIRKDVTKGLKKIQKAVKKAVRKIR